METKIDTYTKFSLQYISTDVYGVKRWTIRNVDKQQKWDGWET